MIFEQIQMVVFVWIINADGELITVVRDYKGEKYTGLPGTVVRENEACHDCALRVLNSVSLYYPLKYKSVTVASNEGVWDDKKSSLNVMILPNIQILSLKSGALWAKPDDQRYLFDITIGLYLPDISRRPPMMVMPIAI